MSGGRSRRGLRHGVGRCAVVSPSTLRSAAIASTAALTISPASGSRDSWPARGHRPGRRGSGSWRSPSRRCRRRRRRRSRPCTAAPPPVTIWGRPCGRARPGLLRSPPTARRVLRCRRRDHLRVRPGDVPGVERLLRRREPLERFARCTGRRAAPASMRQRCWIAAAALRNPSACQSPERAYSPTMNNHCASIASSSRRPRTMPSNRAEHPRTSVSIRPTIQKRG